MDEGGLRGWDGVLLGGVGCAGIPVKERFQGMVRLMKDGRVELVSQE